ncbi:MAG: hypothetical protein K6F14_06940 [Clostridiales bacterium]|nr:hypothetical protein [Clostridiales bacterium]
MKKFRKLIPALALLLVSAVLMSTASYAWFSMNNKVTVTGMEVKTYVSDNLYVAPSTAGNNKSADSAFKSGVNQTVSGTLQPVSTISALPTAFYTTTDAAADGSKQTSTSTVPYTLVTGNDIEISGTHYKGYVDYVVELKAVNASNADRYVNLSKVNLLYMGAATNVTHAFRIAVFAQAQASPSTNLAATEVENAYAAISTTTANSIMAPTSFAYFGSTAVSGTAAKAAVSPVVNNAGWSAQVAAGKTQYFKVTVRLWLEGEDTDCNNTKFVSLTESWALDLAFSLDSTNTSVALIGSVANATNSLSTNTFTAALTNDETAATYAWYKIGTADAIDGATEATYTASANGEYYCVITTTEGNTYMTPVVKYPAS